MLLKTILVVIGILAVAYAALGIQIWLKGKFPSTEIESNPNMQKLGIKCAQQEEREKYCNQSTDDNQGCPGQCSGCSIEH